LADTIGKAGEMAADPMTVRAHRMFDASGLDRPDRALDEIMKRSRAISQRHQVLQAWRITIKSHDYLVDTDPIRVLRLDD
jgi:hypothetical protein